MFKIYPKLIKKDKEDLLKLLHDQNINFEENIDTTFGQYEGDKLVASASIYKNIIKCVAIDDSYKGGAVFNSLMTSILNEIHEKNFDKAFVYTKPVYENSFSSIGFEKIEDVGTDLIFMERAHHGFKTYLQNLEKEKVPGDNIGAVVLNANPFTLGHRYLIEYGKAHSDHLHIFVVSEDESYFNTEDRFNMVKLGTSDLANISLHKTDNYLISSATFPSYFIDEDKSVTKIQASLDAKIFKNHIAKVLNIKKRFVGEEKTDQTTNIYNQTMKEIFEKEPNRIELIEIPRKKTSDETISASKVRAFLRDGELEKIKGFVPETTYNYIKNMS
ncbi:MAG: [citrate (pro-3S)-lyase] ligase [Peptoniphilus duerdenii]|uniref:[citrate (pro-3S)-lyase] ligase n=1 Tax=Peptoniphilus duerdenii TaxID=507750 RepID=UPI00254EE4B7|nr:[citrate (pro-3S)-lyase] ligase [Peptoniphilus duerdenii]MDK8276860.1 [citrate (pro-3S)-lyase] ligase [Peptoniphilus duerdenii]